MKMNKSDERSVKNVVGKLNKIARANGFEITRRAVNRWGNAMRATASLQKRKMALEKELAKVSKSLR